MRESRSRRYRMMGCNYDRLKYSRGMAPFWYNYINNVHESIIMVSSLWIHSNHWCSKLIRMMVTWDCIIIFFWRKNFPLRLEAWELIILIFLSSHLTDQEKSFPKADEAPILKYKKNMIAMTITTANSTLLQLLIILFYYCYSYYY